MRDKGRINGSFLINPYNKPPYWIFIGISAAYIMQPSLSLFCYNSSASFFCAL